MDTRNPLALVLRVSGMASAASEALVPRPIRVAVDRTLVDAACATHGGPVTVADRLGVDVPAVDAWRSIGVPAEFRPRLAAVIALPPYLHRRAA